MSQSLYHNAMTAHFVQDFDPSCQRCKHGKLRPGPEESLPHIFWDCHKINDILSNTANCKALYLGRNNDKHIYNMNGIDLQAVETERDIGVLMSSNLKPSLQCTQAANRASAILTKISRAFMYRDRRTFLNLYKQFVRSQTTQTVHTLYLDRLSRPIVSRHAMLRFHVMFFD